MGLSQAFSEDGRVLNGDATGALGVRETESRQAPNRERPQRQTRVHLAELGPALEDHGLESRSGQLERGAQPAEPRPDDDGPPAAHPAQASGLLVSPAADRLASPEELPAVQREAGELVAGSVDPKYLAGVRARLDPLFEATPTEEYDPSRDRIVVFSDHHRGIGDGADDFRRCEHAYTAALGFYLEAGYRLLLLGDVEELWEVTKPRKVFARYADVLALERRFAKRGGLDRFWGNHDDRWANRAAVRKELGPVIGVAPMREALSLRVARPRGGSATIFFAHGHQGTPESDRFSALARLPVRYIWPLIQRWQGATATTPAQDHALRAKHDRAMFEWSRERPDRILVAGHTHRPVFAGSKPDPPPTRPIPELEAALAQARHDNDEPAAALVAVELEYARTLARRPETSVTVTPPCYFNAGCCSFPDGDITGVELADNEIRLVRWPANLRELQREGSDELHVEKRILARERLEAIVDAVGEPPANAVIVEHRLTGATPPA